MAFDGGRDMDGPPPPMSPGERVAMVLALVILVVFAVLVITGARASSVTKAVSVSVVASTLTTLTPASPTVACPAAAGYVVAAVTSNVTRAVPLTLGGDTTHFALAGTAAPTNLIVGPNGIAADDPICGTTVQESITPGN